MKLTERINEIYERINVEDNEFIKRFCRALDCIDTAVMVLEEAFDANEGGDRDTHRHNVIRAMEWIKEAEELFKELGIDLYNTQLYRNLGAFFAYVENLKEPEGTDVELTSHLQEIHESYVKFIMSVAILRYSTVYR